MQAYRLLLSDITQAISGVKSGASLDLFMPTISTRGRSLLPILYVSELERAGISRKEIENIDVLRNALLAMDLYLQVTTSDISSGRDLRREIHSCVSARQGVSSFLFEILYGALQFAAQETIDHPEADLAAFHAVCGVALHFPDSGSGDSSTARHVEHFRVHAAVFLSASEPAEEWFKVSARAVEALERWGDQVPPEAVIVHAMHNLLLHAKGLPDGDKAYDLVKDIRRKVRRKELDAATAFDLMDERLGWSQSYGLEQVLWADAARDHYNHTCRRVREREKELGASEAVAFARSRGFCAEDGVPLVRLPGVSKKGVSLSFPGGAAIGKTCICLRGGGNYVLIDYGSDPFGRVPYWSPRMEMVDAVLITHAHMDHIGGLLSLYKNGYSGHWMGLKETGELAQIMLADAAFLAGMKTNGEGPPPYSKRDLSRIANMFVPLKPGIEQEVAPGIHATPYHAGHVRGAVQYLLRYSEVLVHISGDINLTPSRSAQPLEMPPEVLCSQVSALVVEGTYAFRDEAMLGSKAAGEFLVRIVRELMGQKKPVLVPVLSLGRAQEVLSYLGETGWRIGVFGMARRITEIYDMSLPRNVRLDDRPTERVRAEEYDVLVASAGCLQGGPSAEFFRREEWTPIPTVLTGYLFPGTPARQLADSVPRVRFTSHANHESVLRYMRRFPAACKYMIHFPNGLQDAIQAGVIVPTHGRAYPVS